MIFTRFYGFVFSFTLFFWTFDLLAVHQYEREINAHICASISFSKEKDDNVDGSTTSAGKGNFNLLPEELVISIFKFLTIQELGRLALVSRDTLRLSEDDSVWRSIAANRGLPLRTNNAVLMSVKKMVRASLNQRSVEKFQEAR